MRCLVRAGIYDDLGLDNKIDQNIGRLVHRHPNSSSEGSCTSASPTKQTAGKQPLVPPAAARKADLKKAKNVLPLNEGIVVGRRNQPPAVTLAATIENAQMAGAKPRRVKPAVPDAQELYWQAFSNGAMSSPDIPSRKATPGVSEGSGALDNRPPGLNSTTVLTPADSQQSLTNNIAGSIGQGAPSSSSVATPNIVASHINNRVGVADGELSHCLHSVLISARDSRGAFLPPPPP